MSGKNIERIAIYAASRDGLDAAFAKAAGQLGDMSARKGYHAYFGGVFLGLMKQFANAHIKNGGRLTGCLPENLIDWAERQDAAGEYEERIVSSTRALRDIFTEECEAAVVLPCGLGGDAEISDWVDRQYLHFYGDPSQLVKPIILFNVNGVFDDYRASLQHRIAQGLITPEHAQLIHFASEVGEIEAILDQPLKTVAEYTQG